jgi:Putative auto-transporter adhesin, head GIN domain
MKRFVVVLIAFTFLFNACIGLFSSVKGEGPVVSETRSLKDFKGIEMGASGDVYFKQASEFKVVVETHKNIAEILETVVEGGVLKINFKHNMGNINYDKLIIRVEAPSFDKIDLSGSGNMTAENALTGSNLEVQLGGSGNISIKEATFSKIEADVSGSGNIEIGGTADSGNIGVTGSGNITADKLKAKTVTAHVTGSGGIDCYAETDLDVSITGSGDVHYEGSPSVKMQVTGSGSVSKK